MPADGLERTFYTVATGIFAALGFAFVLSAASVLTGLEVTTRNGVLWGLAGFWTEGPTVLRCIDCPDWAQEVEQWHAGETDELEIWPYDTENPWEIELPLEAR